jgi:soluble lytic murein transglycosylase
MQFSAILTSLALLGTTILPLNSTVYAQGRDNAYFDDTITEMAQAYKNRDRKRLTNLLPQVRGYILEPWAAYWELSARLDEADPIEIQEFFTRYADTYQEDRLRVELLQQLGRNRDWTGFNRELPRYRMGDDKSVRCYSLLADHITHKADVTEALIQAWLPLREADEACNATAEQLLSERVLPVATVWQRARLGMENDRLRVVTQAVGLLNESWATSVNTIYNNPARYLKDKFTALRPQTREFVTLALIRLASQSPELAAQELSLLRWKTQLPAETRSWIWGAIGRRAAQKLSDDAVEYFRMGHFSNMHEEHLAWAARAALRAGNWAMVQNAIAAMPLPLRNDSTWIYWRARADLALSSTDAARQEAMRALTSIAGVYGFYEQLALEETGLRTSTLPRPEPLTQAEKDAARTNPGLNRGLYAVQIGLRQEGVREWNYTTNLHVRGGMDDRALLAAADMACRAEVWDRCISSSDRTKTAFDAEQRFPMPFRSGVIAQSRQIGLDPAFVYGLIRQESRFVMDARSNVGAAGLMQVMPATAKWTARKLGMGNFQVSQLNQMDTNIAIGTGYLKLLLDDFNGSMPLATAAYNAGPSRSRAWRGASGGPVLEGAIWVENVPFTETRDYVKKVIGNTTNYAVLITGQPQSIKARLGQVGPRDSSVPEPSADLP